MGWLEEEFGTTVPLVGAPMAGPAGGRLAHAVSAAGGLGMFGLGSTHTEKWIREQAALAAADGTAYGIGLTAWILPRMPEQLETVLGLRPALVSVSFGDLREPLARLRDAGIRTATQIGSPADLELAHEAGVDAVVARGAEGGGHGRDTMATLPLLQLVLEQTELPVLAAGGILNHRGLAAVLAAGAAGAWVGTAFLGCTEAHNSPAAKQALFAADQTAYGRVFDVAQQAPWPEEFGGRALANAYFDEWAGREDDLDDPARQRHHDAMAAKDFTVAHLYAGQGVAALHHERTAADVVNEFAHPS